MSLNQIVCGNCLEVLPYLPPAKMVFADPPDNLGMKYEGFIDKWYSSGSYLTWLMDVIRCGATHADIFWFSHYYRWELPLIGKLYADMGYIWDNWGIRQFIWHYTFGQQQQTDFKSCYRPILRMLRSEAEVYPDAIRVPSARQLKYHDKRADPRGCVPGDVWEFPRVCGTFKERRKWHPNQHPEALIERIVKFSCKPGDLVIDMFAGTGTANRVCKRLGIDCIGVELSRFYCDKIIEEQGAKEIKV